MNTDFLTGLHNHRYFYQHLSAHRAKQTVSILYIDFDHVKEINDAYGHGAGDEALIRTASILRDCFPNELIARLGGDEFIVALLGPYSADMLQRQAQGFLNRMGQVFGTSKRLRILSASIGIAQTEDSGMDIDALLQEGDAALYEAKQNGKGRYRLYQKEA